MKKIADTLQNTPILEANDAHTSLGHNLAPHLAPHLTSAMDKLFADAHPVSPEGKPEREQEKKTISTETAQKNQKEKPHYTGHRIRLREKYMMHGKETLQDYEFLEIILSIAIPRRDVKPLAKSLLDIFGSIAAILNAPKERLCDIKGLGDYSLFVFKILCDSAEILQKAQMGQKTILSNWDAVSNYARQKIGHLKHEEFHIWFLDESCGLIAEKCLSKGTINRTAIYPREVIKYALDYHASNIILLHNHPSGDTTPSGADVAVTTKIYDALRAIDIHLFDHIIVGKEKITSFRSLGLIGE